MSLSQGFLGDAESFFNKSEQDHSRLNLAKYLNKSLGLGLSWKEERFWDALHAILPVNIHFLHFSKIPPTKALSELLDDFGKSRIGREILGLGLDWEDSQWVICRIPWVGGKDVGRWLGFHNIEADPQGCGLVISINDNRFVGEKVAATVKCISDKGWLG